MKHTQWVYLLLFTGLVACSAGPSPSLTTPYPSSMPQNPINSPSGVQSTFPSAEPTATQSVAPSTLPTEQPMASPTVAATSAPTSPPTDQVNTTRPTPVFPSVTPSVKPEIYTYRDNFFANYGINPFVEASTDPLSTFAADVDTASYSLARSYLNSNKLPPANAIRSEEFINAFNYRYGQPLNGKFAIHTDLAPSYFGDANTKLLRVGIQGREVLDKDRKPAVLTLVVDVSGSMNRDNRLELVKKSLLLLLDQLRPQDQVAIIKYGTGASVAMGYTDLRQKTLITNIITGLRPEGSTNVEAALNLAYQEAQAALRVGSINRIILCSDGVANVGETGPDQLLANITAASSKGLELTTLGFGMNGYNDYLMEQLANQGNGSYAYIDSLQEAQEILSKQATSFLQTIAKDLKIQVAFNPQFVDQYRLLGYENRDIADEDFRNDSVDAGEVGSNQSVTALYEVRFKPEVTSEDFATVSLRYQDVDLNNQVQEMTHLVKTSQLVAFQDSPASLQLAVALGEFAEILRDSIFAKGSQLKDILPLVQKAQFGYPANSEISELSNLIQKAINLKQPTGAAAANLDQVVKDSQNDRKLSDWENFLIKQLGGKRSQ